MVIVALAGVGLVIYKSGTKLGIHMIMEGIGVWIISFKLGSQILALKRLGASGLEDQNGSYLRNFGTEHKGTGITQYSGPKSDKW